MKIEELLKKRLLFFFVSFIFIIIVTISSSYAILNSDVNKSKVINNGNLEITYDKGYDVINSGYPLSYEQGITSSPSNIIRIKNLSDRKTSFDLYIETNDVDNSLDVNKIYYSINDSKPLILGEREGSIIYTDTIMDGEEYILDIKVWASLELINNSDQGKNIDLKFEVRETNHWLVLFIWNKKV